MNRYTTMVNIQKTLINPKRSPEAIQYLDTKRGMKSGYKINYDTIVLTVASLASSFFFHFKNSRLR